MEMVHIYFDTATFDLIEKDTKNTLETQISVIGGTMGLFTGFSILSAAEIIYFSVKYFVSLSLSFCSFIKLPTIDLSASYVAKT